MIRTVTGDIDANAAGKILMHEHIQCVSNDMLRTFGKKWLDEDQIEAYAAEVLKSAREQLGLELFVDGTACDLGRNIPMLKRISEKSGVKIVASTGLYWYPSMLTCKRSAEELAALFMEECLEGMEGTDVKPGILKCAADGEGMTLDIRKRHEALGLVQARTGLPLYAHCSHQEGLAEAQLDVLTDCGANPEKVIIGHASRRLDADYLEKILKRGCYICIDQSWSGSEDKVAEVAAELCARGYGKKLLFSHDSLFYNDFESGGRIRGLCQPKQVHVDRYSFLFHEVIPACRRAGCTEETCFDFVTGNGIRVLDRPKEKL